MPAVDTCEPAIIRALQKEGWQVIDKPFSIKYGNSVVYADLRLQKMEAGIPQEPIVVEVKCFSSHSSRMYDFYQALGQYLGYETAMEMYNYPEALFLAIPTTAYEIFEKNRVINTLFQKFGIKLIIVDVITETVQEWKI